MAWKKSVTGAALAALWLGLAPQAVEGVPEIPMFVLLHNDAAVPPDVLESARQLASRVFQDAGVQVMWIDQATFARLMPAGPAQRRAFAGSIMQIRIMSRPMSKAMALRDDALGMAIAEAHFAWIAVDKLGDAARQANIAIGDALGYVIAHEIGHLLLPVNPHSVTGLMRKELDPTLIAHNRVRFSTDQGARIRSTLEGLLETLNSSRGR